MTPIMADGETDYADMAPEEVHELVAPLWPHCPDVENIATWSRIMTREAVLWAKGEQQKRPDFFYIWER